jgi:hypothetical protein
MGPDHQLVNRQGPPGRRQPGMRSGLAARPGPGVRQPRPRACRRGRRSKASREDHDLHRLSPARVPASHRRSPGKACLRTTTDRYRDG